MAELALRATSYGNPPTTLIAQTIEYGRGARVRRAFRIGAPLFGGALLSLPIPAWHVVAVPAFLVACVVFSRRRLREHRTVEAVRGRCPACHTEQRFPLLGSLAQPVTVRCPACAEFVKVDAVAA